jgi:CheY-like chemotaxis protein
MTHRRFAPRVSLRRFTLERVFEPFFTTKGVGKGSGLGLSMVYGFVKQSGGHIMIYSKEGRGTTVRIYLPQPTGTAQPSLKVMTAPGVERGRETILIVEDDQMVRPLVVRQIESLGYVALTAASAEEALIVIDGGQEIDLLFTDLIMPAGMNGRLLADEALRRRPSLKILFTSGHSEDEVSHDGRLDDGVLLLAKPYRKSDLARMIRSVLAADMKLQPLEDGGVHLHPEPDVPTESSVSS